MTKLDALNIECHKLTHDLSKEWFFTGWKPAQENVALLGQWIRNDFNQEIQVGPLYPPYTIDVAKQMLTNILARGPAPDNRPDLLLVIRTDDPDYDVFRKRVYTAMGDVEKKLEPA